MSVVEKFRTMEYGPAPEDPKMRRFVANWVARKGAQLEEQRRRWEAEEDAE